MVELPRVVWTASFKSGRRLPSRRHEGRVREVDEQHRDCPIKGNINAEGERIYHMPLQPYYGRTEIDEDHGDQWFCTEDKAQAAGWRRVLR